jgi:hypothetical protein
LGKAAQGPELIPALLVIIGTRDPRASPTLHGRAIADEAPGPKPVPIRLAPRSKALSFADFAEVRHRSKSSLQKKCRGVVRKKYGKIKGDFRGFRRTKIGDLPPILRSTSVQECVIFHNRTAEVRGSIPLSSTSLRY